VKGYQAASIRDIVKSVGMLPGSLYYHFPNKDELLAAVYQEGVRRIDERVSVAVGRARDPWAKLEAACAAHLQTLLSDSAYAKVVVSVQPADVPTMTGRLTALRDGYERRYRDLIDALPLPPRTDRRALRLMLLGALNWTTVWYRPGHAAPRRIARDYLRLLKAQLDAGTAAD
jgi:AcrR family transcriptional regulator